MVWGRKGHSHLEKGCHHLKYKGRYLEGSVPTDEEEKDGEKSCHHNYRKKLLAAVKEAIEEGKMAVVDVAAVSPIAAATENISSAAEETDGKMIEIATDTVDQDLDDKMSEEDSELPSSLPAQPAIITSTSSSAASSAELSTSSSASSSNSFTSAEYDQKEQVSDRLFSKCFPRNNDFSVIVLCLYVQALRTYFMTQKFFLSRVIYRRLHKSETYQHHKIVLYTFSEGDTTLEDVCNTFPKVFGIEKISNALQSMFMGRAFTIL